MSELSPYTLAVDPGLMNGVCLVQTDGLVKLYSAELGWRDLTSYIATTMIDVGSSLDIVVETFRITPKTAKNSAGAANTAIEVIGMVKLLMAQYKVGNPDELPVQTPADAEAFTDSDKLRALGWWHRGGKGHANMAARHVALRLLRNGCREPILLGLSS